MAVSLPREPFLDIARAVLRAAPAKPADPQPLNVALDSIGKAAVLLSKTGTPSDAAVIRNAARARPKSWGVWMAVAHGGLVDSSLATVATGVCNDSTVDLPTRVAAATALEPLAPRAAAFALGQVQSFLTKFGDIDLSWLMNEATRARQNPSATPVTQLREHSADFHLLASLLVLQAPAAKQLTLRSLNAKNFEIQLLCAIVAAQRWPTDLLASGLPGFSTR